MTKAMKYEDAIRVWGAKRIEAYEAICIHPYWARHSRASAAVEAVDPEGVTVAFDFSEGYACCNGTDPDCYCSYAESPRAEVVISAPGHAQVIIPFEEFHFATILGEIVAAGGGEICA